MVELSVIKSEILALKSEAELKEATESQSGEESLSDFRDIEVLEGPKASFFQKTFRRIFGEGSLEEVEIASQNFLPKDVRGHWSLRIDFILSCIGFAVGLGNIWRFPFKVLQNGGGSFLVAYIIMLYVLAVPLFLLELLLAQFTSRGVTQCWHFAPGLKGIGYVMLLMSLLCSIYYNLIIGWTLYYFINSFKEFLPWSNCNNNWNDNKCVSSNFEGIQQINNSMEMSSEQFWMRHVTTRVRTINWDQYKVLEIGDNPQTIIFYTALTMTASWIFCAVILMYGIKASGKSMWVLATFPYVILTLMIIVGCTLEGSGNGIRYYLGFNFPKLLEIKVWRAAAEQIFYSLGVGFGGMLTFGSYNEFSANFQKDVLIISAINSGTSIYGGFAIFQFLGHMAFRYNDTVPNMSKYAGDGLIFIVYPEILSKFRGANILCILFFLMIFCLGMDSQIGMMETVITGMFDEFPYWHGSKKRRIFFVWVINILCNLSALILVTETGFYWFIIMSYYSVATNLLMVGHFECIAIVYVYGIKNLNRDFRMMLESNLNIYWKVCLMVPIPITTLFLTIYSFKTAERTVIGHGYNKVTFPLWADILGWSIFLFTLLPIPIYFIYYIIKKKRTSDFTLVECFKRSLHPDTYWGPGNKSDWKKDEYYKKKLMRTIVLHTTRL